MSNGTQAIAHVFIDAQGGPVTGVDLLAALSFKINGRMKLAIHYTGDKETLWLKKMLEVADIQTQVPDCSQELVLRKLNEFGGVFIPPRFVCRSPFWHLLVKHGEFTSPFTDSAGNVSHVFGGIRGIARMPTTTITFSDYQDYTDPEQAFMIWRGHKDTDIIPIVATDTVLASHYDITSIERVYEYHCTYTLCLQDLISRPSFDMTPVIPVKYDFPDRVENLLAAIDYIHRVYRIPEVVVSEYSDRPRFADLVCGMPGVKYCFTQPVSSHAWSRSIPVNIGAKLVNTKYIGIWDADVVVPYASLYNAIMGLKNTHACIPYSTFVNCHRDSLTLVKNRLLTQREMMGTYTTSGQFNLDAISCTAACLVMHTDYFRHIRGMSELFKGFGWEDTEFAGRLNALGHVGIVPGNLYHICHARGATGKPDPATYKFNMHESMLAHGRTKDDTLAYMGITEAIAPYVTNPGLAPENSPDIDDADHSQVVNKENFVQKLTIPHIR